MKRNLIRIQQFLLNHKSACRNISDHPLTEGIRCMRTSPRTKSSTLWDNSPTNTSLSVPNHPLTGITSTSTGLPASKNLQWAEETPVCGNKNGGSRSVTLDGTPKGNTKGTFREPRWGSTRRSNVECGGVLLSHTLSSAVPSPRPGLSFRVRKGTGRLTWAMTTAKPI